MALMEVKVPDIGDFKEVAVIELLVKPGDTVKAEQSLITVESDKASMEIPSSARRRGAELRVLLGDKVSEGSVVLVLDAAARFAGGRVGRCAPASARCRTGVPHRPAPRQRTGTGRAAARRRDVVPDIGDFKDVAVIELLVKPGDT
jgi:pyruvate dehydrogenase E2 component (dihydrolipoamide acetyltransferase)